MTSREILLNALRGMETPRPAWVPFVGVHGGHLIGVDAEQYLRSSELMVKGLWRARELYEPDGLPVVFDLQLEAEALGCSLAWAKEVPPSVVTHPLADPNVSIAALPDFSVLNGRFPIVRETLRRLRAEMGNEVVLYGLITGPFTLMSHLRGAELFLDLITEPEKTKETMAFCTQVAIKTAEFYLDEGCEVIAVVDPMTSQIGPEHFEQYVAGPLNEIFDRVRSTGGLSSLFVCGDATRNLDSMCGTACDNVSVDENISLDVLRDLALRHGKSFGGNLKLTTALLLGNEKDAQLDALRCIDAGDGHGFVLAPGCDLPYAIPQENLQAVSRLVHDEYEREVARATLSASDTDAFDDVTVPDFANEDSVVLDVITLDSAACAPCQYMMDAARNGARLAEVRVTVREHKIKSREGIGYMCRLGVKNLPTICIDGKAAFISRIPDAATLADAIEKRAAEMGKACTVLAQ